MKDLLVYPIILLVLGGFSAAAIAAFGFDYVTMFKNMTKEHISFLIATVITAGIIVGDITYRVCKREQKKLRTGTEEKERELTAKLKELRTDAEEKKRALAAEKKLTQTYQHELEVRAKEDPELETLRAITRHQRDE